MDFRIVILILVMNIIFLFLIYFLQTNQNNQMKSYINSELQNQNKQILDLQNRVQLNLNEYQNQIFDSFHNNMNRFENKQFQQLNEMGNRMNQGLRLNIEKTQLAFQAMHDEIQHVQQAQKTLFDLNESMRDLQFLLSDKKSRGSFGEVELYSILNSVFGSNDARYEKQYMLGNGYICDAILHHVFEEKSVCIDSKFPLENYNRMFTPGISKAESEQAKNHFARNIKKHIDDISNKYIYSPETLDIAFLFVPAEAIFAEIYGHFDDVVQYAYRSKVYIVSPTTLMAYLTSLRSLFLQNKQGEKVIEIQKEYDKFRIEFERFYDRYRRLISDFEKTYRDTQEMNASFQKINIRFQNIKAVELDSVDQKEVEV